MEALKKDLLTVSFIESNLSTWHVQWFNERTAYPEELHLLQEVASQS